MRRESERIFLENLIWRGHVRADARVLIEIFRHISDSLSPVCARARVCVCVHARTAFFLIEVI